MRAPVSGTCVCECAGVCRRIRVHKHAPLKTMVRMALECMRCSSTSVPACMRALLRMRRIVCSARCISSSVVSSDSALTSSAIFMAVSIRSFTHGRRHPRRSFCLRRIFTRSRRALGVKSKQDCHHATLKKASARQVSLAAKGLSTDGAQRRRQREGQRVR